MGCSQGGYDMEAGRYAREAARLAASRPDPVLRGAVAQALAHAGEVTDAVETARRKEPGDTMATGRPGPQIRQSQTAVAAGLARWAPETAARLVEAVTEKLGLRTALAGPLHTLPELAGLLLAFPDLREPGPQLREALRPACAFVNQPRQQWHPRTVVILALLERLHCCPELPAVAAEVDEWRRTLPPDQVPYAELGILKAVEGDAAEARRLAEAAPTPSRRATALAAVATYLAGAPVALAADRAAADATVRLCLALAHAAGEGTAPDLAAARSIVRELLAGERWAYAIPLLPRLEPEALVPLGELTLRPGWRGRALSGVPALLCLDGHRWCVARAMGGDLWSPGPPPRKLLLPW
jgi:hypothetical protein